MAIVLAGGLGKTGRYVAQELVKAHTNFILASRRGEDGAPEGMHAAKFDWLDAATYDNPFQHPSLKAEKVSAVYLIAPEVQDPTDCMTKFVDVAGKKYGVKRFVLMCGSGVEKGQEGGDVGKVWEYVVKQGYEWAVLKCTWFMENYLGEQYQYTIRGEGKVYSACGDGKVPFIAAADIGAVAFRALTDAQAWNKEVCVIGPELLSMDDMAAKFSKALSKEVNHARASKEDMVKMYKGMGLPDPIAEMVAGLEEWTSSGVEETRVSDIDEETVGRPLKTFDAFIAENLAVWQ